MEREGTLPGYLKKLRRECRYKQDFVAGQLHIARQTYSHYETGRIRPPAGVLYRLAELYKVPLEEMLSYATGREWEKGRDGEAHREETLLLSYFQKLDEKNREDILSLMQAKIEGQAEGPKE